MKNSAEKYGSVTKTTRFLSLILFLLLLKIEISFIINYERYDLYGVVFFGLVVLVFLSMLFTPVFFGKYSYFFKLLNKSNQSENKLIESIFLGSVVLIFSYALIKISIYPSKYNTTTLIFLYVVCIYAIVDCTRLIFTGKKKTPPKKKLDNHENNTQ